MLTVRDKRNNLMVTNTYDANRRVSTQTYADNTTNTFAYTLDGSGNVTQTDVTDERSADPHDVQIRAAIRSRSPRPWARPSSR